MAMLPEQDLWCAVVHQAIADAVRQPTFTRQAKVRMRHAAKLIALERIRAETGMRPKQNAEFRAVIDKLLEFEPKEVTARANAIALREITDERDEAREWLLGGSQEFKSACNLAGMDAEAVRDRMVRLKRRGWVLDEVTRKQVAKWMTYDGEV